MTHKPDGGPAFPGTTSQPNERGVYYPVHHQGMSLRDWFAGQALSGLVGKPERVNSESMRECVDVAYWVADAMLEYRSKGGADNG